MSSRRNEMCFDRSKLAMEGRLVVLGRASGRAKNSAAIPVRFPPQHAIHTPVPRLERQGDQNATLAMRKEGPIAGMGKTPGLVFSSSEAEARKHCPKGGCDAPASGGFLESFRIGRKDESSRWAPTRRGVCANITDTNQAVWYRPKCSRDRWRGQVRDSR